MRATFAIAGFVALCWLLLVVIGTPRAPAPAPAPAPVAVDRVMVLLCASTGDLARIEDALERRNYGEAAHHLTTLRSRLAELSGVYRERRRVEAGVLTALDAELAPHLQGRPPRTTP